MKLFELSSAYLQIQNMADEMDSDTLKDTLESIEEEIGTKAENIVKLQTLNTAEIHAIDVEIERLTNRKKALESKNKQLGEYLFSQMSAMSLNKIKSPLFTISVVKNPPKVEVTDEDGIPPFYFKQKVKFELDKKELLKDMKDGLVISGAKLVQDSRLQVK